MLLADSGTTDIPAGWLAVAIPLASAAGYAIKWIVDQLIKVWTAKRQADTEDATIRRTQEVEDETRTIGHLEALIKRQDVERVSDREDYRKAEHEWRERTIRLELQVAQLIEVVRRQESRLASAIAHIRILEAMTGNKNVPKWQDPDPGMVRPHEGSGHHTPLPPKPEDGR